MSLILALVLGLLVYLLTGSVILAIVIVLIGALLLTLPYGRRGPW